MDNQLHQRFCTNCGQPLVAGSVFCVTCGTPVNASSAGIPGQPPAGGQSGAPPPYAQAPASDQEDLLLAGLAAGALARQMGQLPLPETRRRPRRPGPTLRGCGCLLLILAILAGPFIGLVLTTGRLHQIFVYVAGGMVALFLLVVLIGMLATKRGREFLLEAVLEGLLGGDSS